MNKKVFCFSGMDVIYYSIRVYITLLILLLLLLLLVKNFVKKELHSVTWNHNVKPALQFFI